MIIIIILFLFSECNHLVEWKLTYGLFLAGVSDIYKKKGKIVGYDVAYNLVVLKV